MTRATISAPMPLWPQPSSAADDAVGFLDGLNNRVAVQRTDGAKVYHFGGDTLACQNISGFKRAAYHSGMRGDGHICADPAHQTFADGDKIIFHIGHVHNLAIHHFVL